MVVGKEEEYNAMSVEVCSRLQWIIEGDDGSKFVSDFLGGK
jgi:hypothetical protein